MSVEVSVDMANFRKAVNLALANSSRELSVATNSRMYFLLSKAMVFTKRASLSAIEKATETFKFDYLSTNKNGDLKWRKRTVAKGRTITFIRIMQKRNPSYIRTHYNSRAEVDDAAEAWANKKRSSIGFMASVWVKALRKFNRFAEKKERPPADAARNVRKQENVNSRAKVARPGFNPLAEAAILVGADAQGTPLRTYAEDVLNDALRKAMQSETAEIYRHLEAKAKKACRDAGMDVRG